MKKKFQNLILNFIFGGLFFSIGFVNTFWGNDPYYGLTIILISVIYFLPIINLIIGMFSPKAILITKFILGFLILWSSLGVGELFDKIQIMKDHFPQPYF